MKCLDEGILQSYIDGEIDMEGKKNIEKHLINCIHCADVYKKLKENDDFIYEKIIEYKQYVNENALSTKKRIVKIENSRCEYHPQKGFYQKADKKGVNIMSFIIKYKKMAAGICAIFVVTACVTIQPVKAAISNVLSVFRAEKINGIDISDVDMLEVQEKLQNFESEIDMKKFGKIENTGGEKQQVSFTKAEEFAGFPVLQPEVPANSDLEITAVNPALMNFTLNVDNVNQVLEDLGSSELLPQSIDQNTFTLKLSGRIIMKYNIDGNDINIVQTTAPELIAPEGTSVEELYNALRKLPMIPESLQRQLESIKDWKDTIYVPINGTDTIEVDINGQKGFAGTKMNEDGKTYSAIVWSNNGILRTIEGCIDREEIIEIARSMK